MKELLLHVVDISDDRRAENIDQVQDVLTEIDAGDVPQLTICNKIDNLDDVEPRIDRDDTGSPIRVWLSARANVGIDLLFQALAERLGRAIVKHRLKIPPNEGKLRGAFYQLNCITNEEYDEVGNCILDIKLPEREWNRLLKDDKSTIEGFIEH